MSSKGPSAAERARTIAYGVAGATLAVLGLDEELTVAAHVTGEDGVPLLLMPTASDLVRALRREPDLPATLRATDLTPVPLADRVRGTVWLHGWVSEVPLDRRREAAIRISRLHPRSDLLDIGARIPAEQEWTVLCLDVAEADVDDVWGDETIEAEDYAAARPDPFVAVEPGMVAHLDSHHRPELVGLFRARFGQVSPQPIVRAVGLDRFGLRVRCTPPPSGGPAPFDVRFDFPEPVTDLPGMRCAYRTMFSYVRGTAA
ncbi:DUF2470 domain-containing protein [Actinocorallia sp. API 0066]|uniref:DUF2470 domain-containing protein n=1 Tax=Actinocorallia sp. API 0066 TaxID=2896846 RepID=UPI001E519888|nr:DUF2470 domain-containing protein [Actinocorallia sp. API 0066]MCD0451453.1 DUF2470 domain-containing protein [Actinocorallia sp. API 0066]